jgi:anti-anti-sigma factor
MSDENKTREELLTELAYLRRRNTELEIATNEQLFQAAIDATPDWIFIKDHNFRYILANENIATALGTTPTEMVGKNDLELGLPEELVFGNPDKGIAGYRTDDQRVLTGETIHNSYDVVPNPDGSLRIFDTIKVPLRNKEGTVFAAMGFARDITDLKRMQEAALEREAQYRALFQNMKDSFAYHQIVVDDNKRPIDYIFLEINKIFEEQIGLKREQVIGKKVTEVLPGIEKAEFDWIGTYGKVALTGEPIWFEQHAEPLDKWYLITAYSPQPGYFAVIFSDVTKQKQVEAERERVHHELIEAQQQAIAELSTPIIPIMDGIIIVPIVGTLDSARARNITRALLAGISQHRAKSVILDITGVSIIDSGIAGHLDKTIQAARLKGAQTIITGISDAVAETVVDLGIDWSQIQTGGNLQAGLAVAMSRR